MRSKLFFVLFAGLIVLLLTLSFQRTPKKSLELVHFDWDSSIISAEIAKILLERDLGYQVNMTATFPAAGWAAVGAGMADVCVSVWLPDTHKSFYESLNHQVEILSACTDHLQLGLAVPSYVTCNSLNELKGHLNHFNGKIYGIDPGAGIMVVLESACKEYGLNQYEIIDGSEAMMLASIDEAIKKSEWIVFTAWSPHPMFQMYGIKYLEDPKCAFGNQEFAAIIARKNFQRDLPDAYKLLNELWLEKSEIEQMQYAMRVHQTPAKVLAQEWVDKHFGKGI